MYCLRLRRLVLIFVNPLYNRHTLFLMRQRKIAAV
ncbi:zinc chelation protein SecC [Neisseria meningitidis]|nr:zinc chelation protein SecC [Neisseria meningitidis]MBG8787463.1 zinc chelation protein SecC [Neisseria meningitidis]MBJ7805368.1 zinc chelation protein SecC [Neisseria meningitidis]